jgi:hypothetical protein
MPRLYRNLRVDARHVRARDVARALGRGDGMKAVCPLLAQSGHRLVHCTCPLLGVKRTWLPQRKTSAIDLFRHSTTAGESPLDGLLLSPRRKAYQPK